MSLPVTLALATLPYLVIVVGMLAVEVALLLLLLPRGTELPTLAFGILVLTALIGSAGALLGVFWAVLYPNLNSLTIVFEALGISMGFPPGLWMISIIALRDRRIDRNSFWWPAMLAAVATLGEILMGLVFVAAGGPLGSPGAVAAATLVSPWYLWSSAVAMLAILAWIRMDTGRRVVLIGLAVSGFAAPWVMSDPSVGAALMTGAMAVTFAAIYWAAIRRPSPSSAFAELLRGTIVAYVAMAGAGVAVAWTAGSVGALVVFGGVMTAVMVGELRYLLSDGLGSPPAYAGTVAAPTELSGAIATPRTGGERLGGRARIPARSRGAARPTFK